MSSESLFAPRGIVSAFHYAPLHYLLFIARASALLSKLELARQGFGITHFRRISHRQDELRGFSEYVHLTLNEFPPIVRAKLTAGFPHFEIRVPADAVAAGDVHLCRYNIAKCRYLRRKGNAGLNESASNGRYYGDKQLPIAVAREDCAALLDAHYPSRMIEVLIPGRFELPPDTSLLFFRQEDLEHARSILSAAALSWRCGLADVHCYRANERYVALVRDFLEHSLRNAAWKGGGLEFDSV